MSLTELHSLLLIFTIAAVAPFLCEWVPGIRLPLVVTEIILGILVGPQVLGWATAGPTIEALSRFGLAALFFSPASKSISPYCEAGPLPRQ
jgi:Kef-type K+ transport system membrane component KefB